RIILVGLGQAEAFTVEAARRAAAAGILRARELKVEHAASIAHGSGAGGLAIEVAAQAVTEGSLLALYRWNGYKSGEALAELPTRLDVLILDEHDTRASAG